MRLPVRANPFALFVKALSDRAFPLKAPFHSLKQPFSALFPVPTLWIGHFGLIPFEYFVYFEYCAYFGKGSVLL